MLLPFAAIGAVTLTVRLLRDETRRRGNASRPKRFYTASTAALFLTILVDPVAGFLGYVGSHAIGFIIVHRSVGPKYPSAEVDGRAPVGYALRRLGRAGFFATYIGVVFGALSVLDRYGSPTSYTVVVLTLGGMHVFYEASFGSAQPLTEAECSPSPEPGTRRGSLRRPPRWGWSSKGSKHAGKPSRPEPVCGGTI